MDRRNATRWISLGAAALMAPAAFAALLTYDISMNTAPLQGHPASPFTLDFQFNDGSGAGDGNNTVLLNNFDPGSGQVSGVPQFTGGVTGMLNTGIVFTDSSFLNEYQQPFVAGDSLSFRIAFTTNADDGGVPDLFTFAILDSTGAELPTLSPFDDLLEVELDSIGPSVQTFAFDSSRGPAGGGQPIDAGTPVAVEVISSVPEPSAFKITLLGLMLAGLLAVRERARFLREGGAAGQGRS